jgi:hypothetical protein
MHGSEILHWLVKGDLLVLGGKQFLPCLPGLVCDSQVRPQGDPLLQRSRERFSGLRVSDLRVKGFGLQGLRVLDFRVKGFGLQHFDLVQVCGSLNQECLEEHSAWPGY